MTPDDPRHGEVRGYAAHIRDGEEPCAPCRHAQMRYLKVWRLRSVDRDGVTVAAIGYRRRVQALWRLGWPSHLIAQEAGVGIGTIHRLIRGKTETLRTGTAKKLDAAYERLCMTPGPSKVSAKRAAKEGHPPPLAWNDIDTDMRPRGVRDAAGAAA